MDENILQRRVIFLACETNKTQCDINILVAKTDEKVNILNIAVLGKLLVNKS